MSMVLKREAGGTLGFWCPGCREMHTVEEGKFTLSGTPEKPTIRPAFVDPGRCILFVTDGMLEYLISCRHEFKARTIAMRPIP